MPALLIILLILLVVAFIGFVVIWMSPPSFEDNLKLAAKILNSKVEDFSSGSRKVVEGNYKGRKVVFQINFLAKAEKVNVRIIPRHLPKEQKTHVVSFPQPTKDTFLCSKGIYYIVPFKKKLDKARTKQDIINVFEKLKKAAEIVESNSPYYKRRG